MLDAEDRHDMQAVREGSISLYINQGHCGIHVVCFVTAL